MYFEPRCWATGQRGFYFAHLGFAIGLLLDTVLHRLQGGAVGSDLEDVKPVSDLGKNRGGYQTTSPARLDLGLRLTQCGNPAVPPKGGGVFRLTVWIATRAKHTAK